MLGTDRVGYWRRWLRTMTREVGRDDPAALAELLDLADELRRVLIPEAARAIQAQGYSWADIGRELGVSRVTAYQRFAQVTDTALAELLAEG
jgi:hypothetical protein